MERVQPGDLACDVLVVGGGGAGLRAALAAVESAPDRRVLLATKGRLGQSGTTALSCSDRMAFHATLAHTEPGGPDAWRPHAEDVYRIGGAVSDWDLAEILARESAAAFAYLDALGVPFVKREGRADQFLTDGSVYARACYTGPYTANHIHQALLRKLETTPARVVEECLVAELAVDDGGRVAGAVVVDAEAGRPFGVRAGAVVLATGGAGEAYATHVYPPGMTGDGYALGLGAGCPLVNLEFVQLGLCSVETKLACSGSMMRALPRFVDDRGDELLLAYFSDPTTAYDTVFLKGASWPVSCEHASWIVDLAVARARAAGRRVYLDYSANPRGLDLSRLDRAALARYANVARFYETPEATVSPLARLQAINPASVQWLAKRGIDLAAGDRVEIAPAAQHFQGGVKIRRRADTAVPGLFAAGECAGGQHGANRPGGHSLLDGQVFGRIAGQAAAEWAGRARTGGESASRALAAAASRLASRLGAGGVPAGDARREVQSWMDRSAGVVRTAGALGRALMEVRRLRAEGIAVDERGPAFSLETQHLAQVAEALLAAALLRRESRGPHLFFGREDDLAPLPRDDAACGRCVVVRQGPDGLRLTLEEPVRPGG